jgi:hypothetical protein
MEFGTSPTPRFNAATLQPFNTIAANPIGQKETAQRLRGCRAGFVLPFSLD